MRSHIDLTRWLPRRRILPFESAVMNPTSPQREDAEPNWADLIDELRAQAWERIYAIDPGIASVARRRDAEVDHRGRAQQQL